MPYTTQCHIVASGSFPDEGLLMFVPSKVVFDANAEPGNVLKVKLDPDRYHIGPTPPPGWWISGTLAGEPENKELLEKCLNMASDLYRKYGRAYANELEAEV